MDVACRDDSDDNSSSFIVYVIRVNWQEKDVTYFHASSSEFFIAKNVHIPENIQASTLFSLSFSSTGRALFSTLSITALQSYLSRQDFAFTGKKFDSTVLRSLLLGTRVHDYLQSAATVVTVNPLVIRIPRRPHLQDTLISTVRFITEAGQLLEVLIDDFTEEAHGHMELYCSPLDTWTSERTREHANGGEEPAYLPSPTSTIGLLKNSRLLLYDEEHNFMTPTQTILEQCYQGSRPVVNRSLLDRLYGKNHSHAYAGVMTRRLISIKKKSKEIVLTPAQSEAVRRYQTCTAFALTGPPGSGKTLVAAAMATSYCEEGGNQLVLVPSPSGLTALARALVALDTINKAFVLLDEDGEVESLNGNDHLYTTNNKIAFVDEDGQDSILGKEDMEMEHAELLASKTTTSKIAIMEEDVLVECIYGSQHFDTDQERMNDTVSAGRGNILKKDSAHTPEMDQTTSKNYKTFWELDNRTVVILTTVDTVLKMMAVQIRKDGSRDEHKLHAISDEKETQFYTHAQQLLNGVTKIIIDEANQLAEPALVALTQCFPGVQTIAVIGDARQLPPRTFYGLLSNQLAGSHALDLFQRKLNVPSIQMAETHRHSADLMPYSELFYGMRIPSTKLRRRDRFRLNVLSADIDRNCLLVEAPGWKATQVGDSSWINDVEINALMFTLKKLREAGQESIMIICLYEAQRQLALATLPDFYAVMTVEEAQGREADIVIVLTTVDKLTVELPFLCPNRCNVATSRHREALIILGKQKLLTKFDPWSGLVEQQYFDVTYCDYERGIFIDPPDDF